jgi:UDP-GlcNAc3NAcA epimerase
MLLTVVGARPQFIKAAAVSCALERAGLRETLVHTGQHYDENMSAVFFSELGVRAPDHYLGVGSATHGVQTGQMLERLDPLIAGLKPEVVIVYGDTNSTLAGALAASKMCVPVAHVEAGLRSFNRSMAEEQNRIVADHLASLLFAPTETAVRNLQKEGIDATSVCCTGDVMYDVALMFGERANARPVLKDLGLDDAAYCLATIHRAENTDDHLRLSAILEGLCAVAREMAVVLPLHPRTRNRLGDSGTKHLTASGIRVLEPQGYLDMVALEKNARVIATDSGGVQKEAFFYGVPCVTLRDETEWVELVDLGWNRIVSPSSAETVATAILSARGTIGRHTRPYGNGDAATIIAQRLAAYGS